MVLVETSIWVQQARGWLSLDQVIPEGPGVIVPPIVQEVLQGTNRRTYDEVRAQLMAATLFDDPMPMKRFEEAAQLYIRCRDKGFTLAPMDLLIAACAIAHDLELYTVDSDYTFIAEVAPLRLFTPSPT